MTPLHRIMQRLCELPSELPGDDTITIHHDTLQRILAEELAAFTPAEPPQQETKVVRAPTTEAETVADPRADDRDGSRLTKCVFCSKGILSCAGEVCDLCAEKRRSNWREWLCFMFTDNSPETQTVSDEQLRLLICKNADMAAAALRAHRKVVAPAEPQTPEPPSALVCSRCFQPCHPADTCCENCGAEFPIPAAPKTQVPTQTKETKMSNDQIVRNSEAPAQTLRDSAKQIIGNLEEMDLPKVDHAARELMITEVHGILVTMLREQGYVRLVKPDGLS